MDEYTDIAEWLAAEMSRRGLGHRDLAGRAGMSHSGVGRALTPGALITYEMCAKLAKGLNIHPSVPMEIAGLLPRSRPNETIERDLIFHFRQLDDKKKNQAIEYLKFLRAK